MYQSPSMEPQPCQTMDNPKPLSGFAATTLQKVRNNLAFRSKWLEVNGAMGDLGTYIPIVLALTLAKDLNLGTTLIFTAIYNILTGALYGLPMPVQPMKSIAAVAISNGSSFGIPEVMAAGICTSGALFLLGVTGLMETVYRLIPLPVVRGVQLSQGLSFAMTAVKYIRKEQDFSKSKSGGERHWRPGARRRRRLRRIISSLPSAFIVFLLGVVLAIVRRPHVLKEMKIGPSPIKVVKISKHAWKEGFIKGAIPQLPLSLLNSVIAVCKLSSDLFPEKNCSVTSVSVTVGLMNLVGCWEWDFLRSGMSKVLCMSFFFPLHINTSLF
ncbi:unnamed protein product, partial [Vitis vinifera]